METRKNNGKQSTQIGTTEDWELGWGKGGKKEKRGFLDGKQEKSNAGVVQKKRGEGEGI